MDLSALIHCYVCDFGFAMQLGARGTSGFTCPAMLTDPVASRASDVFSFGRTLRALAEPEMPLLEDGPMPVRPRPPRPFRSLPAPHPMPVPGMVFSVQMRSHAPLRRWH